MELIVEENSSLSIVILFGVILIPLAWFAASLRGVSAATIYFELFLIFVLMSQNIKLMATSHQTQLYVIFFIIRLMMLMYQSTYGNLPMSGGDSGVFHENALNIIQNSEGKILQILNPPSFLENRGDFFERMVALVYYLCGEKTQYIYYVSYIASEIVFYYINKTAYLLSGSFYISATTSLIFYIWPLEMVYSVDYLREMTMQAVFAISLYCFLLYLIERRILCLIPAFVLGYICVGIHSGMIGILAGYMLVIAFYDKMTEQIQLSMGKILIALGIVIIFMVSPMWNEVMGRFNQIDNAGDLVARVTSNSTVATTDYISSPSSSYGIILQTPIRLLFFLVSPLIWQIKSLGTAIAMILDGIPRLYLVYNIVKNWRERKQMSRKYTSVFVAVLLIVLCSQLVFSWGTNNYGTAMRHRLKVFPAELLLMNVFKPWLGMEKKNENRI